MVTKKTEGAGLPLHRNGAAPAPLPAASHLDTSNPDVLRFQDPDLRISVMGGVKLSGLDRLRVVLKVELPEGGGYPFRDSVDLYSSAQVERLVLRIAELLAVEKPAVRLALHALTEALEHYRLRELDALSRPDREPPKLSEQERKEALAFLSASGLMERTNQAIAESGVVGEVVNRLLMFVAFTSRKLARPLHTISLGESGTGKTHLQEAVGRLIPEEDRIELTTLSGNALYYFGEQDLRHKLLLIEDLDGAEAALYPLRELQSKGRLTKTVAVKDSRGRLRSVTVQVQGPVSVAGCSTRERLYEDNANRSLALHLDQSPEQDEAILAYQRRLASGEINQARQGDVRKLVQNAQRLLRPLGVRNPYASRLVLPAQVSRRRRTNQLYLSLIEAVAFYHQKQREVKTDPETGSEYLLVEVEDIAWANRLLAPVLVGRSDELSGACRTFFEKLKDHLEAEGDAAFRASEIRRVLGLSPSNLNRHLNTLSRYGLVEVTGGSPARGYDYRLTGADDYPVLADAVQAELEGVVERLRQEGFSTGEE